MSEPIWQSTVTAEMVASLSDKDIELLTEELDDAVARICEDFGVE
jgi:trehalose-6-phosphate synthase